jgi:membrane protein DedA with SNARE-associated domain
MMELVTVTSVADFLKLVQLHGNAIYLFAFTFAFSWSTFLPAILAGYAAHQGALDPAWTFGIFWIGSALGDELRFFIGRRWGRSILQRVPSLRRPVEIVIGVLNAYPVGFILTYRFASGMRTPAGLGLGMTQIPRLQFSLFNLIAAAIWATVFVGAGYSLGHVSEKIVGDYANGVTLALLGVFVLIGWLISRRLKPAAP